MGEDVKKILINYFLINSNYINNGRFDLIKKRKKKGTNNKKKLREKTRSTKSSNKTKEKNAIS